MNDAEQLRTLLRRKFPKEQAAMLYEVRDAAGFSANRSADVIMVGLWPSRGCKIEGFEVKVSRSDWLRELKKPEKAEAFVRYCDHWWVLAGDESVVRLSEVPETWGLMVPRGGGLGVLKDAPRLPAQPIERGFLAAMLKRACATGLDTPEVRAELDRIKQDSDAKRTQAIENYTDVYGRELRALQCAVSDFEKASGVKISEYMGERIGEAVRCVLAGEHTHRMRELHRIREQVKRLQEWLDENIPPEVTADAG